MTGAAPDPIPGQTSTGSKRADALFGGLPGPRVMVRSEGCRVWDDEDRAYIDMGMALGAVALGYGHPAVVAAVTEAARAGGVSSLPPVQEDALAERLLSWVPGGEAVRFHKTGAEAVAAAVRLARVVTNRDGVLTCGYHGWLDWCQECPGVPEADRQLHRLIRFNDVADLEAALSERGAPAAIVIEPVVEDAPDPAWLAHVRRRATDHGAALILDEIKTGIRFGAGGAAARYGVTPDAVVLGKALGNGLPVSAVVGSRDLLDAATRTWISSTLATETVALAGALAVLDLCEETDALPRLQAAGDAWLAGCRAVAARWPQVIPQVHGVREFSFLRFANAEISAAVASAAARRGVLVRRGPYNFPSAAHAEPDVAAALDRLADAVGGGGGSVLIDVHAHFYTSAAPRGDWQRVNARRLDVGQRIGITAHVASILGTWGAVARLLPSPADVEHANDAMVALSRAHPGLVFGYCVVNPNYTDHALGEIERRLHEGMVGIKLAASRRADDPLLDPIAALAAGRGVPILHHVWQHRRREWPGQEASDAVEVAALAARHPQARFILAHLGGGGDWQHTLRVVGDVPNVWIDLSGSGMDSGMLDAALDTVGARRLLWGADVTLDTGWAKLRYLEAMGLPPDDVAAIRHRNAVDVFPEGVLRMTVDVSTFVGTYPFRLVPGATAEALLRQMDRLRIAEAWVGHLAAPWHRDPREANLELLRLVAPHAPRLLPVPTVHPALPGWEADLGRARDTGAPAVRAYPRQQGLDPAGAEMRALVAAAAGRRLPVILTDRFEDGRQAHPLDVSAPLPAAALRQLARLAPEARLLVTHAGRATVEEVHFGLTPDEARTLLWEISWIWGPPDDHLALLLETVGEPRFTFGTGMPLRLGDGAVAKLDLLDAPADRVARLTGGNLRDWLK